jgi:tripartite-type tricarboxylate transporter receptor subunit TctC
MRFILIIVFAAIPLFAAAQPYPSKPVRIVVNFPAGGIADLYARIIGGKVQEAWGQPVVIENRTGAGGNIGADAVAKSAPDGYTLNMSAIGPHAINVSLFARMPFDPVKDFAPVMIVGYAPMAITTGAQKPYKSFQDVLAAAKSASGVTLGNVGNGSLAHLTTIVLNQASGAKFVPVAYKGGGPLSTDLIGGHVELAMASTAAQAQHVRGGKMRALVLTGDKRSHTMPDVPTLKELGIDVVAHAWWGILAPAGTPRPIIDKLVLELRKAIALPDVSKMLQETQGMEVIALGPDATQKWIVDNIARWGKVVKDNNIRAE